MNFDIGNLDFLSVEGTTSGSALDIQDHDKRTEGSDPT